MPVAERVVRRQARGLKRMAEILDGLVARYTDGRQEFWAAKLAGVSPDVPLETLVGSLVDESVAVKARAPAYWSVLYGTATGDKLATESRRLHGVIAEQVAGMLLRRTPSLDPARAVVQGTMIVAIVKAVLPLITSAPPDRAADLVAEVKTAVIR